MAKIQKSIKVIIGLTGSSLDHALNEGWQVVNSNNVKGSKGQTKSIIYVLEKNVVDKNTRSTVTVNLRNKLFGFDCKNGSVAVMLDGSGIGSISFDDAVRIRDFFQHVTENN